MPAGVRTLVFSGEHDTVTSAERQRAFAARIPGSRFLTVPDADHRVVLERAEDVAELVSQFFTDGPPECAPAPAPVPRPVPPRARSAAFRELPSLAVGQARLTETPGFTPGFTPGLSPGLSRRQRKAPPADFAAGAFSFARGLRAGPRGVSGVTPAGVPSGARGRFRVMPGTRRTSRTAIPSRGPRGSDAWNSGEIGN
ncbi:MULTISPECIES: alpha/beta fold hydrolase [unclassified Streptomyces]|uniref:alpha/beta fold hydrolase n=1 Tax=Streptomyces TaxID=1883 RepID=UPI0027DAE2F4|nr:alpha/beta hydrolase [Streptomyces sp. 9-7]